MTFCDWLDAQAPSKNGPSGIGKENYAWSLQNVHLVPMTWEQEVTLLQRELARTHASLKAEEERNRGLPALPVIQTPEEYQRRANDAVTRYLAFLEQRKLYPMRANLDPALRAQLGEYVPLESRNFFAIATHYEPLTLYTHFYHWWDLARMRDEPHASPIRASALLYNIWDSRAEGMATAMEEFMLHAGLFDDSPRAREIVWIMLAQRAARGLASLYAHANLFDLQQAKAFQVEWTQQNPIDLETCTRCNACIRACPEQAIDYSYQIDLDKCKAHRACVKACGPIGAIDFARNAAPRTETFDLVLDLSRQPLLRLPQLPQGYCAPGADPLEQALAAQALAALVGEFEKPRYFNYEPRLCAHSRSGRKGCDLCLEVCSSGAITADGDKVKVEAHTCAGCGGCATVCPSGAMTHVLPRVPELGARLKAMLATYRDAGGKDACLLLHDAAEGRKAVLELGRRGKGLPARVIPMECFHVASIGIDLMLGAIAYGASQVCVLATDKTADTYVASLRQQMGFAEAILQGLGYEGGHFSLVEAGELETRLWGLKPAQAPAQPAAYNLAAEKRTTLDFAFDHLAKHAKRVPEEIALPAGAPFGALQVDKDACTLCKACIGACPEAALLDAQDAPQLRFIERNCVQCGLCADTCPEDAIRLVPRLLLGAQAKQAVVLNEAEAFNCVSCGKPFGTKAMIDAMLVKVGGHSMFAGGGALKRLQMCADCRVVDMVSNKDESTIHDYRK